MRAFRLLLRLYPRSFRDEYGTEMADIFAARRRRARGPMAALGLWASTVGEIVWNAAAVHRDLLQQDLRHTSRVLRRSPAFAVTAIAILGLGTGANAAVFSLAKYVLIRPLPFPEPDALVKVWQNAPGYPLMELSPANYRDWKAQVADVFEGMGAYNPTAANLTLGSQPERVAGARVGDGLFDVLQIAPAVGRSFEPADHRAGARPTVLLSYGLWQNRFGGSTDVLGRSVRLDDVAYDVIGVMPARFRFPDPDVQFWAPFQFDEQAYVDRNDNYLKVLARLRPGVTLEQARASLDGVAARLEEQFPVENRRTGATVVPLRDQFSAESRLLVMALSGAAACVLLITCVNLASLLLARSLARRRELAVRAAMGAGRDRLVRQLLTESLVLAAVGGGAGLGIASLVLPVLIRLLPPSMPFTELPGVDLPVLAFTAVVVIATGIGFGLAPVWRSEVSSLDALRDGERAGGGSRNGLRSALVVAEVTASVVLLITAGLLLRALWRVQAVDPGFRTDGVLTMQTALPLPRYDETTRRLQFYDQVLSEVRAIPGVSDAAYISFLPMTMRGGIWPVGLGSDAVVRQDGQVASLRFVTPGLFTTLGIPLHQGRDVRSSDTATAEPVAVVSESFARRYFPDQALGQHFEIAFFERTIVGVVGDVHVRGLEQVSEPQVYLPAGQVPDGGLPFYMPKDLAIRSSLAPDVLLPAVRAIVTGTDPTQPISNVRPLDDIVRGETASRAVQMRVLAAFAVVALLLAGIGIHGQLAYSVSQRTQEFGVRIALGASPGDVGRMVWRGGVRLALMGILPGAVVGYAAGRGIEALLAGVSPADPGVFALAVTLSGTAALAGSLLPALRATRVDPIRAIRQD